MQPPPDEHDLIQRAQQGDKAAVSALYSAYVQAVYRYVRYRVDADATAEDITSEVFLRMVRELPRFRYTGAPLSAWLYRIARNCITDHYRKHDRAPHETISDDVPHNAADPLDAMTRAEEHAQLQRALHTLPPDYQNVLILRFINNVSHAEIASILGKTEAAARVLQHRALKALGAAFESGGQSSRGRLR